jgi:hypothetical protein
MQDMPDRSPVMDWTMDWDHLDARWRDDPFPIWDELRKQCPIAHTTRYLGLSADDLFGREGDRL